jgi:hypothetical protein
MSAIPDGRKRHKSRPTPSGSSFLSSFFATFTPTPPEQPTPNLKSHRSEVELRRSDYLSPEREKEIGEIWETFKLHQTREIDENKMTSFPCIVEYEDEEEDGDDERRDRRLKT